MKKLILLLLLLSSSFVLADEDATDDIYSVGHVFSPSAGVDDSDGMAAGAGYLQLQILRYGGYRPLQPLWYETYATSLAGNFTDSWDNTTSTVIGETHISAIELVSIRRLLCVIVGLYLVTLTKHAWTPALR